MERYEKYKDSGIDWLGEIPEHWNTVSLKWISHIYAGGTPDKNKSEYWFNGDIPWLNSGTVNQFIVTEPSAYITEEGFGNSSAKWIEEGSLIVALAGQGKTKGMAAFVTFRTTCNQSLAVIQPKNKINSKYLLYFLVRNYFYIRGLAGEGKRDGLNLEILGSLYIPLFDLSEQRAIATFLDHKTAEIDRLISQKEKLIALYEEEKTAIINQAVTRGIDRTVKLKPSGIDWLGDIPEHWEVKKLRYLGTCQNGVSKSADYFGSGYPFVNYTDVYKNIELPKEVNGLAQSTEEDQINYSVKRGDIFFTRTSETIEEIGIASTCLDSIENAIFSGFLIRFRPFSNLLFLRFSKYYFRSQIRELFFVKEMNLVTRASLSQELLKRLPVLLPPLEEQKAIATYIEKESDRINAKIAKTKRIIELQKEYRTALISEAVTGKIKVFQND